MSASLNIAFFHASLLTTGGQERIAMEQVLGLRRRGHKVSCYCLALDRESCHLELVYEVAPKLLLPQLPKWIPFRVLLSAVLATFACPVLARRHSAADIMIGSNQPGNWLAYLFSRLTRKPYVTYFSQISEGLHGQPIDNQEETQEIPGSAKLDEPPSGRLAGFDRRSVQSSSALLANGIDLANLMVEIYGEETINCPAGSHCQSRRLLRLDPEIVNEGAFKLGGTIIDKPYVLVTSRQWPESRIEDVITAMAEVRKNVPRAMLVVSGAPTSHTPVLMEKAEFLSISEWVVMIGAKTESDLQRLYREAAVYCHPEKYGRAGTGMIEAMAWGIPVVAANHAGAREVVEDGRTGFLFEPDNAKALADSLAWLLRDHKLRGLFAAAGWDRARRHFSWSRHIEILEAALLQSAADAGLVEFAGQTNGPADWDVRELPDYMPSPPDWAEAETVPILTEWEGSPDA